jgi:outer membrane receptor protein involved in Fe transport
VNCAGIFSTNCGTFVGQLQPKWSWNQRTTLSFKPVDVSLLWRHISSFTYQFANSTDPAHPPLFEGTITGTGPFVGRHVNLNKIPAYDYFDLTARFGITDHFDLTLSAFNIFDKQPPIVGGQAGTTTANSGNTFPTTFDALGRRYGAAVRLKF